MTYTFLWFKPTKSLRSFCHPLRTLIGKLHKLLQHLSQRPWIFRFKQVTSSSLHKHLCRTGRNIRTHCGNAESLSLYKNLSKALPCNFCRGQDKRLCLPNNRIWVIELTSKNDTLFHGIPSRNLLKLSRRRGPSPTIMR